MKHRTLAIAVGLSTLIASAAPPFLAQERVDSDINAKIRKEAQDNSKILRTLHYLTDVYGPRLTGSPNLKAAGEWAIKEMASWGFANGRLEPWDFARPGWTNDVAVGAIVSPVKDKLEFEVLAWTPSTDGTIKAKAFNLITPDAADEGRARDLPGERQGTASRMPSCSSAGRSRCPSTWSRQPSARRTTWRGAATTRRRRAADATDAADEAAVMSRPRARARCRPPT